MKKILIQASYILLISSILFISCKKDQQSIRSANQQSSNDIKLDTTFRFTVRSANFFDPINWVQKDFYIPILDSIFNPDLKVYRTLISTASTTWQEVYPDSAQTAGPHYVRSKGYITYSEQILSFSAKIAVRILARW
jgi:hypothetical protein